MRPGGIWQSAAQRRLGYALALLLGLIGLALAIGGARLLTEGGTLYYLIVGLMLMGSAWLIVRGDRLGSWLYAAVVALSVLWGLAEVGLDGWALLPRLGLFIGIA